VEFLIAHNDGLSFNRTLHNYKKKGAAMSASPNTGEGLSNFVGESARNTLSMFITVGSVPVVLTVLVARGVKSALDTPPPREQSQIHEGPNVVPRTNYTELTELK
jgi:hypothetical protein